MCWVRQPFDITQWCRKPSIFWRRHQHAECSVCLNQADSESHSDESSSESSGRSGSSGKFGSSESSECDSREDCESTLHCHYYLNAVVMSPVEEAYVYSNFNAISCLLNMVHVLNTGLWRRRISYFRQGTLLRWQIDDDTFLASKWQTLHEIFRTFKTFFK